MLHELKCWPAPFQATADRKKHHEIRVDDRGFQVGDQLLLREWDPKTTTYTGQELVRRVSYITRGPDWGIPAGLVVMSMVEA